MVETTCGTTRRLEAPEATGSTTTRMQGKLALAEFDYFKAIYSM
jgi:hypothetical protein